jgi:hypothetical protein
MEWSTRSEAESCASGLSWHNRPAEGKLNQMCRLKWSVSRMKTKPNTSRDFVRYRMDLSMVYTEVTLKKLFALSGNVCAFPGCTAPIVDTEHGIVTGEICHIKARSPEGPRYAPVELIRETQSSFQELEPCSRCRPSYVPVCSNVQRCRDLG